MKGVILETGLEYFTPMDKVLTPFLEDVKQYNWLITDCECNWYPDKRIGNDSYDWLSGEELIDIITKHDIQFIWAVFSAFPCDIPLEEVLKYDLPYADGFRGFWKNPVNIQHPMASIEIVPWDSGLVLFMSRDVQLVERFEHFFPESEDLEEYNRRE